MNVAPCSPRMLGEKVLALRELEGNRFWQEWAEGPACSSTIKVLGQESWRAPSFFMPQFPFLEKNGSAE